LLHFKRDILEIVQSNEPDIVQKYLYDYVLLLQNKIDQYTTELLAQAPTCPSTLPSLEMIDQRLQEFVRLHHLDLQRGVNYQISQLNNNTTIKKFFKQLSQFRLTPKQVLTFAELKFMFPCFSPSLPV
jgi:hypothetical protein